MKPNKEDTTMADERTRYSDAELEEFKQLILKKARKRPRGLRAAARHDHPYGRQRHRGYVADVQGAGRGCRHPLERGKRPAGSSSDEVHPQPRNGARAHREQDLRHLQDHRQAHPQGAPDEGPPRHRMYRARKAAGNPGGRREERAGKSPAPSPRTVPRNAPSGRRNRKRFTFGWTFFAS